MTALFHKKDKVAELAEPPPYSPPYPGQQTNSLSEVEIQQPPIPMQQPSFAIQQPSVPIQQPVVAVINTSFADFPIAMKCPFCSDTIITSMDYYDSTMVWLVAGVLCFVGCWPCCLIPFCVDDFKDVQHSCPNCNRVVGTFRRM